MKIGNIELNHPIALAPMEDVTDTPFRLICKRLGADLLYTEFASSEALIRNIRSAFHKITVRDEERPIGIQIFGGIPLSMEKAAQIIESARPDFIDINCGCWVKNFVARGEGAGLLRDLKRFEQIVKGIVKNVSLPVTVKTRLGWDKENIVILDVAKMVEQAGAKVLTVHCRTRMQGFKGKADWSWLEKIKKNISIPLIGNGDIVTPEDVKIIFESGCDGAMIGRSAISNPWIFSQAKHFLKTGKNLPEASIQQRIKLCMEHLSLSVEFKGEKRGIADFRKHYSGYLREFPGVSGLRSELVRLTSHQDIVNRLECFI